MFLLAKVFPTFFYPRSPRGRKANQLNSPPLPTPLATVRTREYKKVQPAKEATKTLPRHSTMTPPGQPPNTKHYTPPPPPLPQRQQRQTKTLHHRLK